MTFSAGDLPSKPPPKRRRQKGFKKGGGQKMHQVSKGKGNRRKKTR